VEQLFIALKEIAVFLKSVLLGFIWDMIVDTYNFHFKSLSQDSH